jgi:hypothetical protein
VFVYQKFSANCNCKYIKKDSPFLNTLEQYLKVQKNKNHFIHYDYEYFLERQQTLVMY